jgi:hypothetical protein
MQVVTHLHERVHYFDADFNCLFAAENRRKHGDTLFGKGVGSVAQTLLVGFGGHKWGRGDDCEGLYSQQVCSEFHHSFLFFRFAFSNVFFNIDSTYNK